MTQLVEALETRLGRSFFVDWLGDFRPIGQEIKHGILSASYVQYNGERNCVLSHRDFIRPHELCLSVSISHDHPFIETFKVIKEPLSELAKSVATNETVAWIICPSWL